MTTLRLFDIFREYLDNLQKGQRISVTFYATAKGGPELNVSNRNASYLLGAMGIDFDYAGRIAPHYLRRRTIRLLNHEDRGTETVTEKGIGKPTMIDCGIPPGYFAEKGLRLAEIADYAIEHDAEVCWA